MNSFRFFNAAILIAITCCAFTHAQELMTSYRAGDETAAPVRTGSIPYLDTKNVDSTVFPSISTRGGLEDFINAQMAQKHIAGLSSVLWKDHKVIWTGTFGYANFDAPAQPVENDTLFMLASISKTVTVTALMQLWEEGEFDLHESVNNHLPFEVVHPYYPGQDITFHMLMTHTSGIKDNWGVMTYYPGDSPIPLGVYLEDYLTEGGAYYSPDLNFYNMVPGTNYHYSNIAVALIGYLVETISGTPLEPYCQDHIFGPLKMNESSFFLANLDPTHIAMPYWWNGSSYTPYGHFGYSDYPAGQLRTSAPQLMTFLTTIMKNLQPGLPPHGQGATASGGLPTNRMHGAGAAAGLGLLNDPPPLTARILKSDTVEAMLTAQIPGINPSQGLIWFKTNIGGYPHWGHGGGDQGVRTQMYYCLELDIGMVVLTNGESGLYNILTALFDYAQNY